MLYLFRMKGVFVGFLLVCMHGLSAQQTMADSLISSANDFLEHNLRDSVKTVALQLQAIADEEDDLLLPAISNYYLSEGLLYEDPESSLTLASAAVKTFKGEENWEYVIKSLKSQGNGYKLQYEYDSAASCFGEGLHIMEREQVSNPKLEALLNYGLGAVLRENSEYQMAIACLQKASELSEEQNDSTILISSSIQIAAIFFEIENFGKSIEYFDRARQMTKSPRFKNLRYFIDNGLAHVFKVRNELDTALVLFQSAYEEATFAGDEVNASVYLFNIADLLVSLNRLDSAKRVNAQMMGISSRLLLKENLAFGHEINSRIYSAEGHHGLALRSAQRSVELSREIGDPEQLSSAYKNLFQINSNAQNYESALHAYIQHDRISDSLLSSQNIEIVEELETRYETEKKDRSIEQLTQMNQIQDLSLSKQRLWLFISLIGILGLILLVLAFNFLHKKRLAEQAKESEDLRQKLLRIQLNPHFTYNSLNAIQSMIYENQDKQKTADYLSRFSSLMRNILELNQQDYITLDEELDFIENYIEVQQMRFDHPITYHIEVADDLSLEELLIPPMITQPFLENAFEHGFPDKSKSGEIWISLDQVDDWLILGVCDDGVGRDHASKKTKRHNSLATKITEERLSHISTIFKRESGVEISDLRESGDMKGTKVKIKLPLIYD